MDVISPDRCDTMSVADWLIDGARSAPEPHQVLAQCAERLVGCGIPLWRVAVFVRTLHPNIPGRAFVWRTGKEVEVRMADFELFESEEFRNSPVAGVYERGVAIRRRLADQDCPIDFAVLDDLLAEGVTDYLASPLVFTNGAIQVVTFTTRQPGGFTQAQMGGLETILTPLARVAEVRALRREATNLLDTYVGHQAGARILDGQIRRGHVEAIHAAIWLSDMRGFTASADCLPLETLIDLLNRYFDCQVPPILEAGGEVLKFMGDGLLAIFPIDGGDAGPVCERALAAARNAGERIAAMAAPAGLAAIASGSVWRCTSARCFTATSAAATGWISPVSGPRSISRRGWKSSRASSAGRSSRPAISPLAARARSSRSENSRSPASARHRRFSGSKNQKSEVSNQNTFLTSDF